MTDPERPIAAPALTVLGGLLLLVAALVLDAAPGGGPAQPGGAVDAFVFDGPGLGILIVGLGGLTYWLPRYRLPLGTATVLLGVLGLSIALGVFLVGTACAVLGGVLALVYEPPELEAARAETQGALGWSRRNYWTVPVLFLVFAVALAVLAPTLAVTCTPVAPGCAPGVECPALLLEPTCDGPWLWPTFLLSAICTTPAALRLRAEFRRPPIPA